ncbi:hypothetical protein PFISCL1PPCAC_21297, partial [Pristionchus fissidentatus]
KLTEPVQQLQRPQQLHIRGNRASEPGPNFPMPDLQHVQPKSAQPIPDHVYEPYYENEVGVARALFSNASEYPDELAFARGSLLRVIHDPEGPELSPGWWYCVEEKTGARGIAPANRLELIMAHFDQGFFNVANPLFDDFFMFSGRAGPPSEAGIGGAATGDLFDRRRRMFPGFGFDDFPGMDGGRMRSGSLGGLSSPFESMRRASTATAAADESQQAFRGVVRNIPIRVEHRESAPVPTIPTRSQASSFMKPRDDFSSFYGDRPVNPVISNPVNSPLTRDPTSIRRTVSSGQLSPTPPDDTPVPVRGSQTTLNSGSRVGSFADFPSQRKGLLLQEEEDPSSPVERLAQRLRNLAARNGEVVVPITVVPESSNSSAAPQRTPSPSSSGIVADMEKGSEENKRSSDVSSLSDGANSSFERNSNSSSSADERPMQPLLQQLQQQERQPPPPAPPMVYPKPATTTSALPSVFDAIGASGRPVARKEEFLPSSIAEDMRRNESSQWKTIPTRVNGQSDRGAPQQRNLSSITESEMAGRKRALVTRMADYLRMIERAMERLRGASAAQFWREPHVLQKNLPELRDSVTTINEALDHFVDSTARIAIDNSSTKSDELRAFLLPLRDSRALIGALRQALDLGGWTLATLARDKNQPRTGLDSIEQFLIVVKRVPQECGSLLDWLAALAPDPPIVCFMAAAPSTTGALSSATGAPLAPFTAPAPPPARVLPAPITAPAPVPFTRPIVPPAMPSPVPSDDSKRLSSSSTTSSTVTSGDSSTSPPSSILKQPNGGNKGGARVTFADDVENRRLSSGSLDGASSRLAQLHAHFTSAPGPSASAAQHSSLLNGESRILEEDDLESVLSERDSLYQDYALLDEPRVAPKLGGGAMNGAAGRQGTRRLDISDEDRQLVRFYAPQLAQHTDALSLAIDEFIDVVEHQLPPREFVQKGKLIILAAHKLIYIGDSVSQCVKDAKLSVKVRAGADHLCNLLKECVAATKSAAEEYPNITHVQRMVDTIVGVSRAATDLKLLVESHI